MLNRPIRGFLPITFVGLLWAIPTHAAPPEAHGTSLPTTVAAPDLEPIAVLSLELADEGGALVVETLGRTLEIDLERNHALFPARTLWRHDGEEVSAPRGALANAFVGSVVGEPGAWARLHFVDGQPDGLLFTANKLWEIRQDATTDGTRPHLAPFGARAGIDYAGGFGPLCGTHSESPYGASILPFDPGSVGAVPNCLTIDLAAVGDYTFVSQWGGMDGAENRVVSKMNEIDGLYRSTLNVGFVVSGVDLFPNSGGAYQFNAAGGISIDTGLYSIGDYRENPANAAAYASGLTHLMTSRYEQGTVGLAWVGVTCQGNAYATGVSSDTGSIGMLVTAHELGHNFNAPHDGDGECAGTGGGYIMAPMADPANDTFSQCSEDVMTAHVNQVNGGGGSCFSSCNENPGDGDGDGDGDGVPGDGDGDGDGGGDGDGDGDGDGAGDGDGDGDGDGGGDGDGDGDGGGDGDGDGDGDGASDDDDSAPFPEGWGEDAGARTDGCACTSGAGADGLAGLMALVVGLVRRRRRA